MRFYGGSGPVRGVRPSFAIALTLVAFAASPSVAHAAGNAYVANYGSSNVSQYAIGAGGELSPLSPATVGAGIGPSAVAITPDRRTVYVTNAFSDTVSQYDVDPQSGALSPKVLATVTAGMYPDGVAVTPDGNYAYVSNGGSGTVSQYEIDQRSGALSPKTPASVSALTSSLSIAINPDGKSAYAAISAPAVAQYDIDPLTGNLSFKSPSSVSAAYPLGVAVTADGRT